LKTETNRELIRYWKTRTRRTSVYKEALKLDAGQAGHAGQSKHTDDTLSLVKLLPFFRIPCALPGSN